MEYDIVVTLASLVSAIGFVTGGLHIGANDRFYTEYVNVNR
jgi:hypothetical protein